MTLTRGSNSPRNTKRTSCSTRLKGLSDVLDIVIRRNDDRDFGTYVVLSLVAFLGGTGSGLRRKEKYLWPK